MLNLEISNLKGYILDLFGIIIFAVAFYILLTTNFDYQNLVRIIGSSILVIIGVILFMRGYSKLEQIDNLLIERLKLENKKLQKEINLIKT